jgi:hypothetical protein
MGLSIEQYTPVALIFLVSVKISKSLSVSFKGSVAIMRGYFLLSSIARLYLSGRFFIFFLGVPFEAALATEVVIVAVIPSYTFHRLAAFGALFSFIFGVTHMILLGLLDRIKQSGKSAFVGPVYFDKFNAG